MSHYSFHTLSQRHASLGCVLAQMSDTDSMLVLLDPSDLLPVLVLGSELPMSTSLRPDIDNTVPLSYDDNIVLYDDDQVFMPAVYDQQAMPTDAIDSTVFDPYNAATTTLHSTLSTALSVSLSKRKRRPKVSVPDALKDEKYMKVRLQNTIYAKRCRDRQRSEKQALFERLQYLESANGSLWNEVYTLRIERQILLNKIAELCLVVHHTKRLAATPDFWHGRLAHFSRRVRRQLLPTVAKHTTPKYGAV